MDDLRRKKSVDLPRELQPLAIGTCYHCDTKALTNTHCELWSVWACKSCLEKNHRTHHADCRHAADELAPRRHVRHFTLYLTRYDGHMFAATVRMGLKIEMEDHWLGTYLYFPGSTVLVLETRKDVNELILEALRGKT